MIDTILLVFACMFLAGATCWLAGYYAGLGDAKDDKRTQVSNSDVGREVRND